MNSNVVALLHTSLPQQLNYRAAFCPSFAIRQFGKTGTGPIKLSSSTRSWTCKPHVRIPVALSTNTNDPSEAYIFQPSPYRSYRRNINIQTALQKKSRASSNVTGLDATAVHSAPASAGSNASTSASESAHGRDQVVSSEFRYEDHAALTAALHQLTNDPLSQYGGRIVEHRGSPSARLMIIGEGPGEQENEQGIPFVGEAGQLLDKIFEYGGFDMHSQVYITNVVKRRPPQNRAPTAAESAYYIPYLMEEVRLVNPEVIVLAGNVAARAFLGNHVRITKVRGNWFGGEDGKPWLMPVFHPAHLLRKESSKYEMVLDIEAIRGKYLQVVPEDKLAPLIKKTMS